MTLWLTAPSTSTSTSSTGSSTTLAFVLGTSTILFAVVSIYQWNRSRTLQQELNDYHQHYDHETIKKKELIKKDDGESNSNESSSISTRNNKVFEASSTDLKVNTEKHNHNDTKGITTEDVPLSAERTTTTFPPPPVIIGYMESIFRHFPIGTSTSTSFPVISNARGRIRLLLHLNSQTEQRFEKCNYVGIVFLCHHSTPSVDLTLCRLDRLEEIIRDDDMSEEMDNKTILLLHVSSIPMNLVHGTPILCIKPYYCSEVPLNDFVPPRPEGDDALVQKVIPVSASATNPPKSPEVKVQFSEASLNQLTNLFVIQSIEGQPQPQPQSSCLEFYHRQEDEDVLKLCIQEMIRTVVRGNNDNKNKKNTIQMDNLIISYAVETNGFVATTTTEDEKEYVVRIIVTKIDLIQDDVYNIKQLTTVPISWEKPSIEENCADKEVDDKDDGDDQESIENHMTNDITRLKTLLTSSSRSLTRTSSDPTMNESFSSQVEETSSPLTKKREGYINVDDTGIYKIVTETGQSVISDDIVLRHVDTDLLEEERRHLQRSSSDARVLKAAVDQRRQLRSVASSRLTTSPGLVLKEEEDDDEREGDGSTTTISNKKQQDFHSVKSYWNEASKRNTPTNYYSGSSSTPTRRR